MKNVLFNSVLVAFVLLVASPRAASNRKLRWR